MSFSSSETPRSRRPRKGALPLNKTVQPQQTKESVLGVSSLEETVRAEICAHAGVAQLVEHRFCKPEVRGSSPLASSGLAFGLRSRDVDGARIVTNEDESLQNQVGCPSGQREQAVNLPALAYVGSNPTPTTSAFWGVRSLDNTNTRESVGTREGAIAGVAQLVERQPSKLNVVGSNPISRSVVSHTRTDGAHIAQLVERVLGKDEVTSSTLVVGSQSTANFSNQTVAN